jgi:hypothetical protein
MDNYITINLKEEGTSTVQYKVNNHNFEFNLDEEEEEELYFVRKMSMAKSKIFREACETVVKEISIE